ncbi:uncharacterized protein LOC144303909 [Canis aureus]
MRKPLLTESGRALGWATKGLPGRPLRVGAAPGTAGSPGAGPCRCSARATPPTLRHTHSRPQTPVLCPFAKAEPHPARRRGSRWLLLAWGSGPPDAAQSSRRPRPPSPQLLRPRRAPSAVHEGRLRAGRPRGARGPSPAGPDGRFSECPRRRPETRGLWPFPYRPGGRPLTCRKSKKMVKGRANKLASGMEMQTDGWGCMDTDTQGKPKLFSLLICPAASQWCPFSAAAFPASGAAVMVEADGY